MLASKLALSVFHLETSSTLQQWGTEDAFSSPGWCVLLGTTWLSSGLWSLLPQPDSKGGMLVPLSLGLDGSSVSFCMRADCPESLYAVGEEE